jgi:hypothetical protein
MSPQDMQFQHAEPLAPETSADDGSPRCVVCKRPTGSTYFHARGMVVCPGCAEQIRAVQQAPPAISLGRAALYGGGAALAGCLLYAAVAILLNMEIGLIAILVGYMVGRAIRHASHGRGGRAQQVLAVALTYFAITTSYIPVYVYHAVKESRAAAPRQADVAPAVAENVPVGATVVYLLMLAAVAPFLRLGSSGLSGLIGLFIIFIGLQRAWRLSGRSEIPILGPYPVEAAQ